MSKLLASFIVRVFARQGAAGRVELLDLRDGGASGHATLTEALASLHAHLSGLDSAGGALTPADTPRATAAPPSARLTDRGDPA